MEDEGCPLVVPIIEGSLRHLEVRTADTLGQLVEEGHHHLGERVTSLTLLREYKYQIGENILSLKERPSIGDVNMG